MQSKLVGRTIKRICGIRSEQLTFETDGGDVVWEVDPDCCSSGEFTDVLGPCLCGVVKSVKKIESMVDPRLDSKNIAKLPEFQECMSVYGVEIQVAGSEEPTIVIHRNWSNGYYGNFFRELP